MKARTTKRLSPGERWTGSLLDEAQGSEFTPHALEDDGGRVGIRALVLQPHAALPLPPLVPEFRRVRRAPLRRTDFEQFGCTYNCPGCANARAGRKQAVDHSEQCRSLMEAILMTTTEGHERLERARDRFAHVAKEPGVEEPQRKRHCPEGEGRQPPAPPASSNYREGGSCSSGSALQPPPAPPPLEKRVFGTRDRNERRNHRTKGRAKDTQGSISKCLKPLTAVAAVAAVGAAVKAQPTLKWDWWMCALFSLKVPRPTVVVEVDQ